MHGRSGGKAGERSSSKAQRDRMRLPFLRFTGIQVIEKAGLHLGLDGTPIKALRNRRWVSREFVIAMGRRIDRAVFSELHDCVESLSRNPGRSTSMDQVPDVAEPKIHPVRGHYLVYVPIDGICIVNVGLIRQTQNVSEIVNANGFTIQRQLKEIAESIQK